MEEKFLFVKNVRTTDGIVSQILEFDTAKEAEITFHNEVAYGLALDTVVLAHYEVKNEHGAIYDGLVKTIG